MGNYLYPHFAINIKRRAIVRGITLVILFVAAISILYGVWGPTLTPAVPDDLTAVRLSGNWGNSKSYWEYTVTDPKEVATFARVISDIGPLPKARPSGETYFGTRTFFITLIDSAGGELTYTLYTGGSLRAEDSREFEFLYNDELKNLIFSTVPEDTPNWKPLHG